MTTDTRPTWRTSSYTGKESNCVEVAPVASVWRVRDTKHRDGGELAVPTAAWQALTDSVRQN